MALDGLSRSYPESNPPPGKPMPVESSVIVDPKDFVDLSTLRQFDNGKSIIVTDSMLLAHPDFEAFEKTSSISLAEACNYQPPEQHLPKILGYRDASNHLGSAKTVAAIQLHTLADHIPALKTDPEFSQTLGYLALVTPQTNAQDIFTITEYIRHAVEDAVRKHGHNVDRKDLPDLVSAIIVIIDKLAWLKKAAADNNFYNTPRDNIMASAEAAFYDLIATKITSKRIRKNNFILLNTEVIFTPVLKIKYQFEYETLRYTATADVDKGTSTMRIVDIETANANDTNSAIAVMLGNMQNKLKAVNVTEELNDRASIQPRLATFGEQQADSNQYERPSPQAHRVLTQSLNAASEQTPAQQTTLPIQPEREAAAAIAPKSSNWIQKAIGTVTHFFENLKNKKETPERPRAIGLWHRVALAGVMGFLGISSSNERPQAPNNQYDTTVQLAPAVARPIVQAPVSQRLSENRPAPQFSSSEASVHSGLQVKEYRNASVQRGIEAALHNDAGKGMLRNLYPESNLNNIQLADLANTIGHRLRQATHNLHTHSNREIARVTDMGASDNNMRLFEIELDNRASEFVQIHLPRVPSTTHHRPAHRATPSDQVAPDWDMPAEESDWAATVPNKAPNTLQTQDQVREQESAMRKARREELRRHLDELRATTHLRRNQNRSK